jgi:hypothetical protein
LVFPDRQSAMRAVSEAAKADTTSTAQEAN